MFRQGRISGPEMNVCRTYVMVKDMGFEEDLKIYGTQDMLCCDVRLA
jgi:hypothetical protein